MIFRFLGKSQSVKILLSLFVARKSFFTALFYGKKCREFMCKQNIEYFPFQTETWQENFPSFQKEKTKLTNEMKWR
jgi:hypothetical protein